MMLAMFASEHKDDRGDLLSPVMMAYRSSVHESTEEVASPNAVWVKDSLEVAFDQVCRHSGQAVQRQK